MKRFNRYSLPPWVRTMRGVCAQFIIPFCIFQGIRTILLPTTFDVLLLTIFIAIALAIYLEVI
ncbi:hypothetical protein RCG23_18135 [Neobacillus sp. PS3-34]|uniref:hypothetical protein n=1 Tax=Neobacillus sp. PS3-34 TaxID=3070678 RepID=UPI0027DF48F6|nr:hypothetical protein [Neobacillus sp. PS3-34]WML47366.1 hypothetical protein RCG23_18135 [Neobacillus sp. PS3-34]